MILKKFLIFLKLKKLKYLLYLLFIWFIIHTIYCIYDGLNDENKQADVAVILATTVNEHGSLSKRLEQRVKCGLQLYLNKRVKKIILSGGFGKEGYFEANKMKDYLIKEGVPKKDIILDNKGNNTRLTVKNTLELQKKLQFKSVIVVSQYFHVSRTKMLFKKQGFTNISSKSPKYFEIRDSYSLLREFVAYYVQ